MIAGNTKAALTIGDAIGNHSRVGWCKKHNRSGRHRLAIVSEHRPGIYEPPMLECLYIDTTILADNRYRIEADNRPNGLVSIVRADTRRCSIVVQVFIYKGEIYFGIVPRNFHEGLRNRRIAKIILILVCLCRDYGQYRKHHCHN